MLSFLPGISLVYFFIEILSKADSVENVAAKRRILPEKMLEIPNLSKKKNLGLSRDRQGRAGGQAGGQSGAAGTRVDLYNCKTRVIIIIHIYIHIYIII
jgi:hypothetical protein